MTEQHGLLEAARIQLRRRWGQSPDVPGMFRRTATVRNIGLVAFWTCRIDGDSPDNQWYGIASYGEHIGIATGHRQSEAAVTALAALLDNMVQTAVDYLQEQA
jgi:hypothetical protein